VQEGIGLELNETWVGRGTQVLVEEARQPRPHDHDDAGSGGPRLVGRNREHKLVHFDGPGSLVGSLVDVRVERAGPYALAGHRIEDPDHA
jgi:tRNA A37 methylthiotransferase MiaB